MPASNYDTLGIGYARRRQADPRLAAQLHAALGDARRVLNVGAGAGSYEPNDRIVQAVEPSHTMIAQRPASAAPCVCASAEELPFADGAFDAAMAVLTIHHWTDWRAGLAEMRRVARRIVLLTFDIETSDFWLFDYFPALAALDRAIMPKLRELEAALGPAQCTPLEIPHDCIDGFLGAYWRRPELYLDASVRSAMSSFARIDAAAGLKRLQDDLDSGAWRTRHATLLERNALDLGYRLMRWDFG